MISAALWILGGVIILVGIRSWLTVPAQADDLLILFDIEPTSASPLVIEGAGEFGRKVHAFATGETGHFYPLGVALDLMLKRVMLLAPSFGGTASGVHHAFLALLHLATLVAASHLARRLFVGGGVGGLRAAHFAVPVAIGFLASAQLTTVWSTYDPLVVHPVFGALVTLTGLTYLALLAQSVYATAPCTTASRTTASRTTRAMCALVGTLGVMIYDGFAVFLIAAVVLIVIAAWRRAPDGRFVHLAPAVRWGVLPPLLLTIVTRAYISVASTSDYTGTELHVGGRSLVAWVTSVQSTAPAGTWGRAFESLSAAGRPVSFAYLAVGVVTASSVIWLLALSHSHAREVPLDDNRERLIRLTSVAAVVLGSAGLFALSEKWSAVLVNPGTTYMGATSSFWAWAILAGCGLQTIARCRQRAAIAAALLVATGWSGVQVSLNESSARAEVAAPTPFRVDLVRVLDAGTSKANDERCALITGSNMQSVKWRANLNHHYRVRHGTAFCDEDAAASP